MKEFLNRLDIPLVDFSRYTGIPTRTLQHWKKGDTVPPEWLQNIVIEYYEKIIKFQKK